MNEQDYILFEDYLLEALSETDKNAFETRLETDSKFNESFITYKELTSFLEDKFENEETTNAFQNNLNDISKNYFDTQKAPKKVISFKSWQLAIAASVLLLIGISIFNNFSSPVYEDFANYESISLTVRGEQDALLKTAETAFNKKDFAKAEAAFKSLLLMEKENTEVKYYSALANIELNKFETADNLLMDLGNGQSAFKNKAIWYLALSKLKQNELDDCLEILKTIPEDADDFENAQKLIKKLD